MPLSSCFPYSKEAYRSGLETGDFVYATYGIFHESWYALFCGMELSQFQQAYRPNLSSLSQIKNQSFVDAQRVILQWGLNLQGLTGSKYSLSDQDFDEQAYAETYRDNAFFETFYFVAKLHILYTFGNYREAQIVAKKASSVVHSLNGTIWTAALCFYYALTLTALYPAVSRKKRQAYWQTLTNLETRMEVWANNCPENFQHWFLLIAAEMANIRGRTAQAVTLYERAIQCAEENGFVHDQGLTNELYARFWSDRGNKKIARLYLTEARFCYEQQGALAKIRDLEERYPSLLVHTPTAPSDGAQPHVSMQQTTATTLDFVAVLKAAQVISGEIVLDSLLEQLLHIVIEHAGAQKGFLIVEENDLLVIEVAGSVEKRGISIRRAITLESSQQLPLAVVNYVKRTSESLVLGDAEHDSRFANDHYVAQYKPKSILCLPILSQGKLTEILYLENNLATNAFTPDRIEVTQILSAQAAISLENARLYNEMTQEMANRIRAEQALRQLNTQLEDYSHNLEQKVTARTSEIEQRRQVAESLRGILAIINSNRSLAKILDYIVDEASRLLGSDTSFIYRLRDPEQRIFTIQTMRGVSAKGLMGGNFPTKLAQAILKGKPVAISDVTAALPNNPTLNLSSRTLVGLIGDCRALLAVPLLVANEVYGCLLLCYANNREFSAEEIELAVAFSDQAALAIENARLRHRIKQTAVLEERGRLARELHDSVTQSLYSLTLLAEGWRRLARTDKPVNIEDWLTELGGIAQQALKEMRLLVHELRPSSLEQEGLIGALQQRLKSVEQRTGMEAHLLADNEVELPSSIEAGLYRIAQEALNNVLKHTTAISVKVFLRTDGERVILEVVDNGQGFDVNATGSRGGFGLISMLERAEELGGRLTIDSILGVGTIVKVEVSTSTTEVAG